MAITMRLMCFALLQGTPGIVAPSIHDTTVNAITMWNRVQEQTVRIEYQTIRVYGNIRFAYQVAERLKMLGRKPATAEFQMLTVVISEQCSARNLILDEHDRNSKSAAGVGNVVSKRL
jgi:hypothetical protein